MRKVLYLTPVVFGLSLLFATWYFGADDGHKTLARAIAAHGGQANIAKAKIGTIKATGRKLLQVHGSELAKSMTWEESFHEPDRLKRVIRQNFMGQSSTFTYVYRDGKLWSRMDDREVMVQDMDSAVLDNLTSFLGQLVEMRNKHTPLKLLGEEMVADRKAIGIEAHSNEPGKLQLFFEKDSARLVMMVKHAPDDDKATQSIICRDYKEVDGLWLPERMSMYRNGELDFELTLKEIKFLDRIDDSVFAKP